MNDLPCQFFKEHFIPQFFGLCQIWSIIPSAIVEILFWPVILSTACSAGSVLELGSSQENLLPPSMLTQSPGLPCAIVALVGLDFEWTYFYRFHFFFFLVQCLPFFKLSTNCDSAACIRVCWSEGPPAWPFSVVCVSETGLKGCVLVVENVCVCVCVGMPAYSFVCLGADVEGLQGKAAAWLASAPSAPAMEKHPQNIFHLCVSPE